MLSQMKSKVISKMKNTCGESITESLVSMLIISLAMLMLAGSIVSAGKVNKRIKDAKTAFTTVKEDGTSNISQDSGGTVTITHDTGAEKTSITVTITNTKDDNDYFYYNK